MKRVAISQRVMQIPDRNETRDLLDQRLVAFVSACGYAPVPVPNNLGSALPDWLAAVRPAAVVLSGGDDIGTCAERDATEMALLEYAQAGRLPLLGICRGMQMLAHWAGTGLHAVQGHVRTRHVLAGAITGEVNSFHGLALAACPVDFDVLARSDDGEIEAIRHQSLPWEGWMWHPERETEFARHDMQRLKSLMI